MAAPDILLAVTPVVEALEALGVAYHIGGSVASSAYGVPRSTLDVDLVADLSARHVPPLVERLRDAYYISEHAALDAVSRRDSFNVIHLETMLKVDVFVLKPTPFDREAFRRRRADTLEDAPGAREFFLATPEDTVLHKLCWYRLGGEVSERQWSDLVGVLQVQAGGVSIDYLRSWASQLQVSDLLERALAEAGLGSAEQ